MTPLSGTTSRHTRPGMTLLELMVTVVIFGSLVTMLAGVFYSSVQARSAVGANLDVIDRAFGAMEILVRDLEAVHAFDSRAYLMVETNDFDGRTGTSMAFPTSNVLRVSEHLREKPGLMEAAYLVGPDPETAGALRLFRRELEIETDADAASIRMADDGLVLLASGLQEFRAEFLDPETAEEAAEQGVEPEFTDAWESGFGTDTFPLAIRILMVVGSDGKTGPAMTIQRTIRIPTQDLAQEALQKPLEASLGIETEGNEDE